MARDVDFDRPGWVEAVIGLVTIAVVAIGGSFLLVKSEIDPVLLGLILAAMSGIGGLTAFAAAWALRRRPLAAFGVRGTSVRWLLIAAGVGVVTFVAKGLAILLWVHLTGDDRNIQEVYATGASGGVWTLVVSTLFLSVLTPIGEEFLFRGVVTSALFRLGPLVGVIGGAFIFALFHGVNMVFPAALVVGLAAGEIFRRSGSIWTAVTVHVFVNIPTIPVLLLARTLT